jgi:hypothetical protein
MPLFQVSMPGNALAFFNQIFKIASFDIVDVEPYINKALKLNDTEPFNNNFDSLGFSSMYFMNNLGTLLIAFLFYFSSIILLWMSDCCLEERPRVS